MPRDSTSIIVIDDIIVDNTCAVIVSNDCQLIRKVDE